MASDAPPRTDPVEIDSVADGDFGVMKLMHQVFHAKFPDDVAWTESSMHYWQGELGGARFEIHVDQEGSFPDLPVQTREMLKRTAATVPDIRREVAFRLLDLAKDWAAGTELPEPTLASFEAGIRFTAINTYEDWRPTLYFEECEADFDRTIFAGHVIEVRLDVEGAITEANIAG